MYVCPAEGLEPSTTSQ